MNFIYGTAWKEEQTRDCVLTAIQVGFRAIDTANQKKHYREDFVGDALLEIYRSIPRSALFLQTKYTYQRGQDHRLPYDPSASFREQVLSSFKSSLTQLHTDYLDSLLLHGPFSSEDFTAPDFEVWRTIEELLSQGAVRAIGVSNMSEKHLETLLSSGLAKPSFVQNRCYAEMGWDRGVRHLCREHEIHYQGFSLLTANRFVLVHPMIDEIAARYGVGPQQVVFRFAQQIGMIPLTGSTNEQHLREDLACDQFTLSSGEVEAIERIGEV